MFERSRAALSRIPFLGIRAPAIVPVVRMSGVIAARGGFGPVLSLAAVAPRLQRAFSLRGAKAVALIINSPGGSPVQSSLIARRIRTLAEEKKCPGLYVDQLQGIEDVTEPIQKAITAKAPATQVAQRMAAIGAIVVLALYHAFFRRRML